MPESNKGASNTGAHIKEAIGVFESERDLEAAIDALLTSGFNRADISLLAGENAIRRKLGYAYMDVSELEDNPYTPDVAYVARESIGDAKGSVIGAPMYVLGATAAGLVSAAGGPLTIAFAAAAAGVGAGAAIGAVLARLIDRKHAQYIESQLDHGGLILWVRTWDEQEERKAKDLLCANNATDVHIHDFSANPDAAISPELLVNSDGISREEKINLLKRWEQDVRDMLRAEGEGMGDCNGELLTRIVNALKSLEAT